MNKERVPGGTKAFNPNVEGSTPSARANDDGVAYEPPTLEEIINEIKSHAHDLNPLEPLPTSPLIEEEKQEAMEKEQMRAYLKIKVKSLAAEAKIIRAEEKKYKARPKTGVKAGQTRLIPGTKPHTIYWGLHNHRVHDVRKESRAACLAYGFLRGRSYEQMEHKCYRLPNFTRIEEIAIKYGTDLGDMRARQQKFAEWLDGAKTHLQSLGWKLQGPAFKGGPLVTGFLKKLVS